MSADFYLTCEQKGSNLHVRPVGIFDGTSARALHSALQEQYTGRGRVLIDTAGLCELLPAGCDLFRARMADCTVPASQLLFKGEKGFALAPEGSRVLVMARAGHSHGHGHACQCVTPCANCVCKQKGTPGACGGRGGAKSTH